MLPTGGAQQRQSSFTRFIFNDGSVRLKHSDGSDYVTYLDGSVYVKLRDGSEYLTRSDGSVNVKLRNGSEYRGPPQMPRTSGNRAILSTSGAQQCQSSFTQSNLNDGSVRLQHSYGSHYVTYRDGSVYVKLRDGSIFRTPPQMPSTSVMPITVAYRREPRSIGSSRRWKKIYKLMWQ